MMDDGALLAGLAVDLDGSFEQLLLAYQDRLYRFALRLSGSPQEAEEIAQDAFVRAYRALQQRCPDGVRELALRPWLYQITLNVYRNRMRRHRPTLAPLQEDSVEDPERNQPERIVELGEARQTLAELIARLPPRYRVPVVLRYVEELRYTEIAAVLGQPEGTAKSNVHRGVQLLRQAMDDQESEVNR